MALKNRRNWLHYPPDDDGTSATKIELEVILGILESKFEIEKKDALAELIGNLDNVEPVESHPTETRDESIRCIPIIKTATMWIHTMFVASPGDRDVQIFLHFFGITSNAEDYNQAISIYFGELFDVPRTAWDVAESRLDRII